MTMKGEFLDCTGSREAGTAFLLEYQKAVLYALQKEGILDQFQMEACIKRLKL